MIIKLKDWKCPIYFNKTSIALNFIGPFFEQFKNMPKLLEPNLSKEEYMDIVRYFYEISKSELNTENEIYAFVKSKLTEERVRKDIDTTRNRIKSAIDFINKWYITEELKEAKEKIDLLGRKIIILEGYEGTFNSYLKYIEDMTESPKQNEEKQSKIEKSKMNNYLRDLIKYQNWEMLNTLIEEEIVDLEDAVDMVIALQSAGLIFEFMDNIKNALQYKMKFVEYFIARKNLDSIFFYSRKYDGDYVDLFTNVIIESNDPNCIAEFAIDIKNAPIDKLRSKIIELDDVPSIIKLIKNPSTVNQELIQILGNKKEYDIIADIILDYNEKLNEIIEAGHKNSLVDYNSAEKIISIMEMLIDELNKSNDENLYNKVSSKINIISLKERVYVYSIPENLTDEEAYKLLVELYENKDFKRIKAYKSIFAQLFKQNEEQNRTRK